MIERYRDASSVKSSRIVNVKQRGGAFDSVKLEVARDLRGSAGGASGGRGGDQDLFGGNAPIAKGGLT